MFILLLNFNFCHSHECYFFQITATLSTIPFIVTLSFTQQTRDYLVTSVDKPNAMMPAPLRAHQFCMSFLQTDPAMLIRLIYLTVMLFRLCAASAIFTMHIVRLDATPTTLTVAISAAIFCRTIATFSTMTVF